MALDIKKIGIIGSGQMGKGIAHVCAVAGFEVHLMDIDLEALKQAMPSIKKSMSRLVKKKKMSEVEMESSISRISISDKMSAFKNCQLVIEAATEDEEIKKAILKDLCQVLNDEAIIASNTSSISITRLAAKTDRPGKVVGMHFMNPVPRMDLVELIRGIATDEETFKVSRNLVKKLGKTAVNAEDFPAFIVNRILLPMINEAVYTLYEGVGSVKAIDDAMKLGTNHPMGPLELADFIGLDTCLSVMHVLHVGLADTKYRPCPLLVKYVEAGWLGRKSGKGFYDYTGETPMPTR
jgi:3-hydroxybutyryl-CoA dehydrogenase